ncbi:serotriflin-like [Anoplophora glabripennis]|uniref:serotriflin-like n=1 Tax=Anoplophora glabripennis TaxID=217634 RepID=UPI000874361C|nr:serotriflin-like [Anoplophora glabripennis]
MTLKFFLPLILLIIINTSTEYRNWKPYRRPKIMGDVISLKQLSPNRKKVQQKILLYHNFFRSRVKPAASNMLRMKWHNGAANAAQNWADECQALVHDGLEGRYIDNYGSCGQNIFIATHKVPWLFAVKTWWLEKDEFTFGEPVNNSTIIGHYTQMVWAASHEIGCGISKCYQYVGNSTIGRLFYNYVCNYCPAGNHPGKLDHPYKTGKPCGQCKRYCRNRLCLNACPYVNMWSNCEKLYKAHPHWLCHSNHTLGGRHRFSFCKATCTCRHRIHD